MEAPALFCWWISGRFPVSPQKSRGACWALGRWSGHSKNRTPLAWCVWVPSVLLEGGWAALPWASQQQINVPRFTLQMTSLCWHSFPFQLTTCLHCAHPLSILEILEMPFLSPCRIKHLSLFNKFLSRYLFCIETVQASFSHFIGLFILCYLKAICKNSSNFTLYMCVCVFAITEALFGILIWAYWLHF